MATRVDRAEGSISYDADADAAAAARRRTREDLMEKLRIHKRHSDLKASKLYISSGSASTELEASQSSLTSPSHAGKRNARKHARKKLNVLNSLVGGVWPNDRYLQLKATIQICDLFSTDPKPPINGVIQSGVVPRFAEFLTVKDSPQLQCEAAWALANIATERSKGTDVVIDNLAVPIFVELLRCSPSADVREQAVFALGVVAGHSPTIRDCVLGHGALEHLLEELKENPKLSMLRNATWALSNFCGGIPEPSFEQVTPALKALESLLWINDWEVLSDSCLALSYLSDGTADDIAEVVTAGFCPRLVELLGHGSSSVVISALQAISNIVSADDTQTQAILDQGALGNLLKLLSYSDNKRIKKEVCFVLSNITAGNTDQIQAVINAQLIEPLVELLPTAEFDTRVYAALAISNAVSGGSHEQIRYLYSKGCLKALCDLVRSRDNPMPIVYIGLDGLCYIMKKGGHNINCQAMIRDDVGLDRIFDLSADHENLEIALKAGDILCRIM